MGAHLSRTLLLLSCALSLGNVHAFAQSSLSGSAMALRSSGAAAGEDWRLDSNGYLGTYVTLQSPGVVQFNISASGVADGGIAPRMSLAVADAKTSFDVGAGLGDYTKSVALPAGTHFVRVQYDNDSASAAGRALTVRSLGVTGATLANAATNANALAAANTYIDNYRKGSTRVKLTGPGDIPLLEGTPVHVKMARNVFNFGGTVSGSSNNDAKDMLQANPAAGSDAQKFQQFINRNFNTIVPSNAGKWSNNESAQNSVNMTLVDKQLNYAAAHNMKARMHTLIWGSGATSGSQQPNWVNTLISSAASGNATAKANLSNAIANRIAYYAGTTGNRSQKYIEIDGLNESLHNPSYWNIYGASGLATIHNQVQAALDAAGSDAKIYLNEWNVVQYSPATISATGAGAGSDPYANWYRAHADSLLEAGGALTGIGIQYYANVTQTGSNAHSAATIEKALQNLGVTGLPISMTEFGLASGTTKANSQALGPAVLEDTMRMFYGNPNATTFMIWGWWDVASGTYPPAAMMDNSQGNNVLSPIGTKWETLMSAWSTDLTATVDATGGVSFNGFYGDYNLGDQTGFSNYSHVKGQTDASLELAAPPTWGFWKPANSGNWSTAGNWNTSVPKGAGLTAHLGESTASRTVTIDVPVTLGQINFDSAGTYTVQGTQSLTLGVSVGSAAINVVKGRHTIDARLALSSDTRVWVPRAADSLAITKAIDASAFRLTKLGEGRLEVDRLSLRSLHAAEGVVSFRPGSETSVVGELLVRADAQVDLGDAIVVVDYDGASPMSQILASVQTARQGGTWTGSGIGSALAAGDPRYAVAVAEASSLPGAAMVAGIALDSSAIVVRAVLLGDATMDGAVDFDDLLALAQHYDNKSDPSWSQGDFNYDGVVDFGDLLALAQNYGASIAGDRTLVSDAFQSDWKLAQSIVPEPAGIASIGGGMLFRRLRPRFARAH